MIIKTGSAALIIIIAACNANSPMTTPDNITSLIADKPNSYRDDERQVASQFSPLGNGPLSLKSVHRFRLPVGYTINSGPAISTDGQKYLTYDAILGLSFGAIDGNSDPKHLVGRLAVAGLGYGQTIPFAWASNSRAIYGASQDTIAPSGFALGPVSTQIISIDGQIHKLPELRHPAGNLDGILWVGSDGLALAEFGTKGSYYRPEHEDKTPTVAMVDARHGRILQAISLPVSSTERPITLIGEIDAQIDAQGRMYALFVLNGHRWFEWRQNEELRPLSLNTGKQPVKWFAVTPDLSKVLIMKELSGTGVICERDPKCPPPRLVNGTIAELRDLMTGKVIWDIKGKTTNFSNTVKPAISMGGRYALISMPTKQGAETFALVSMRDGKIIQRIGRQSTGQASVGFTQDTRGAWLSSASFLATYRWNE